MTTSKQYQQISITEPHIGGREKAAVSQVLDSGSLIAGAELKQFEREFAAFCDTTYGVGTANGTTAVHAALEALDIGEGDRVLTTPFSFIGTANAIRLAGAQPVFVDIDPGTFNLDPEKAEAKIRELGGNVDAIAVVHLYGLPAAMDEFRALAEQYDLSLIEDATQAHGATYRGQPVGSLGDVGCFSFGPAKNITTGEGGMIVTDDETVANRARRFINHGRSERKQYESVGHDFRLTDIAAAIGRIQLQRLPALVDARRQHANLLRAELADTSFELPEPSERAIHVYHQFTIRSRRRDELQTHLDEFGIDSSVYYPTPIHKQPAYRDISAFMPEAEKAAAEVISVPVHPQLSTKDLKTVVAALEYFDSYL